MTALRAAVPYSRGSTDNHPTKPWPENTAYSWPVQRLARAAPRRWWRP